MVETLAGACTQKRQVTGCVPWRGPWSLLSLSCFLATMRGADAPPHVPTIPFYLTAIQTQGSQWPWAGPSEPRGQNWLSPLTPDFLGDSVPAMASWQWEVVRETASEENLGGESWVFPCELDSDFMEWLRKSVSSGQLRTMWVCGGVSQPPVCPQTHLKSVRTSIFCIGEE